MSVNFTPWNAAAILDAAEAAAAGAAATTARADAGVDMIGVLGRRGIGSDETGGHSPISSSFSCFLLFFPNGTEEGLLLKKM